MDDVVDELRVAAIVDAHVEGEANDDKVIRFTDNDELSLKARHDNTVRGKTIDNTIDFECLVTYGEEEEEEGRRRGKTMGEREYQGATNGHHIDPWKGEKESS